MRGVMCISNNGTVHLSSRRASVKNLPDAPSSGPDPVTGVTMISTKTENGITTCEYSRALYVPNGSQSFMYDLNINRYAVYAAGAVVNNLPAYHSFGSNNRISTRNVVDVRQFKVHILKTVLFVKFDHGYYTCRTCIRKMWILHMFLRIYFTPFTPVSIMLFIGSH